MPEGQVKFDIFPSSRNGLKELAEAQLNAGQVSLTRDVPESKEDQAGILAAHYASQAASLLQNKAVPASERHPLLSTWMRMLPTYFSSLFSYLGIPIEEERTFSLAEQLVIDAGNKSHYTAPFPVVTLTGEMEFIQHALSTQAHEVTHALGRLMLSVSSDGLSDSRKIRIVKSGISTLRYTDKKCLVYFRYFEEGLAALTQYHFLEDFMGLKPDATWFYKWTVKPDHKFEVKGKDITQAIAVSGLLVPNPAEEGNLVTVAFTRYAQGAQYSADETDSFRQRDRQFLFYTSPYGVIVHHLQLLSHEMFPDAQPSEAHRLLHQALMNAQITGNLRNFMVLLKDAFGPKDAGKFIRFLARLYNWEQRLDNMELIGFCAFVRAGLLDPEMASKVRNEIADAFLQPNEAAVAETS